MKLDRRSLIGAALGFAPVLAILAVPARARHVDHHTEEVNEREEDLPRKEVEARRKNRRRRRRKDRKEEVNEREVDRELR